MERISNEEPARKKQKIIHTEEENGSHLLQNGISIERIRVGSRKSQLALFQSNFVMDLLKKNHPKIRYEIVSMTTVGDNILNIPLSKIGEKSLFTKELEVALEKDEVDVVVHSLKDLPTTLPPGMVIGAICKRIDPCDAVVFSPEHQNCDLQSLPKGSVIGTSSLRRIAQLRRSYPHLQFKSVRGNLNTRLRKLDEDNVYAALVLATAGLERMDLAHRIGAKLLPEVCMHAVGQGALAVECKADDESTLKLLSEISDLHTMLCCVAERSFMKCLEGGCSVPVAVSTAITDGKLTLTGGVFSLDGTKSIIDTMDATLNLNYNKQNENSKGNVFCGVSGFYFPSESLSTAEALGEELAKQFLKNGADKILNEARAQNQNNV